MAQQVSNTFNTAIPVSKSDTVNVPQIAGRYADAIYVGTAGLLVCVMGNGSVVNFDAPQGVLPIGGIVRINSTDTTADELVALWQG